MMNKGTPPNWFADKFISGIQDMHTARLNFRPSSEKELLAMTDLWINTLWYNNSIVWVKELDSDRLGRVFTRLIANTKDWPTPAEYMQWLTTIPRPKPIALPSPKASPETVDREMTKMRGLFADLVNSKRMQK